MSLEKQLNINKLVAAADKRLYYIDEEKKIAKPFGVHREGKINFLGVYRGKLIDGGEYKGIRDSMTGNIIANPFSKTQSGSTNNHDLIATYHSPNKSGVWNLTENQQLSSENFDKLSVDNQIYGVKSNGRVIANLTDKKEKYNNSGHMSCAGMFNLPKISSLLAYERDIFFSEGMEVFRWCEDDIFGHYTEGVVQDPINTYRKELKIIGFEYLSGNKCKRHPTGFPTFNFGMKLKNLRYDNWDQNTEMEYRKRAWTRTMNIFRQIENEIPFRFKYFKGTRRNKKGIKINPKIPFKECPKYYKIDEHDGGYCWKLEDVISSISDNLLFYLNQKNRIDAICNHNGLITIGTKSGYIQSFDYIPEMDEFNKSAILNISLKNSITAITSVPEEIYNGGISQGISRIQYLKNKFANKNRLRIAA